jgi:hypothetical protein
MRMMQMINQKQSQDPRLGLRKRRKTKNEFKLKIIFFHNND